ncbi:FbpB family small basic protein [Salicibibacter halophilus]|uniref:FbpB family small basic protein n=1 Tax=Salicibibacter halophilus TaxID=2502791 RepID=A0A514LLJ0_9BACI|nr:FbpB family small basic protein [Salicibibacter halophilus]QDI92730.1 FbpB family small basic protein [Salicibibacter halophilus]
MRRPFRTSFSELVDQNKQDLEQDSDMLEYIERRVEDKQLRRLKKRSNQKNKALS